MEGKLHCIAIDWHMLHVVMSDNDTVNIISAKMWFLLGYLDSWNINDYTVCHMTQLSHPLISDLQSL